jgi:hypothetical protein
MGRRQTIKIRSNVNSFYKTKALIGIAVAAVVYAAWSLNFNVRYLGTSGYKYHDRSDYVPSNFIQPSNTKTTITKTMTRARVFEWDCWDKCSCLPPLINDNVTITMHQSYKTPDEQTWHRGWKYQRQTWLDLHPHWFFIFWTDEQNELLANCIGFEQQLLQGRTGIQKADLSRLMYLYKYGGFYADMDYIAIKNHQQLFDDNANQTILLQGRQEQVVGLEWGFARSPEHPFWTFCLDIANQQKPNARTGCPIFFTGPKFLGRCIKRYFKPGKDLEHMVSYGDTDLMILEPKLIAPIGAFDFTSECGKWRNISHLDENDDVSWGEMWPQSSCKQNLIKNGTFAVTIYSHSWGEGLKC